MAVLEFNRHGGKGGDEVDMWLGYCAFHMGDYKRAMLEYEALTHSKSTPKSVFINLAVCYFYLGMYKGKALKKLKDFLNIFFFFLPFFRIRQEYLNIFN